MERYHGQEFKEGEPAAEVPLLPKEETTRVLEMGVLTAGTGTYALVRMIGSYGAFCSQKQTLKFSNITIHEARNLRWTYYGACGATMTCFDGQGNVVHSE